MEKIIKAYPLFKDVCAIVKFSKKGQSKPIDGNEVVVEAELMLPTQPKQTQPNSTLEIHHDIMFGPRVKIFGENLSWCWGQTSLDPEFKNFRVRCCTAKANTYKKAYEIVKKQIDTEIDVLIKALKDRNFILENSGDMI